ncbi:MAG: tetratricopeptide repeat protein, partial [Candidatus Omnitrophota bacterium]
MGKHVRNKIISSLLLFLLACEISPTYSRREITDVIKNICKEEFNLDVTVWQIDDSVWVYTPLKLLDQEGKFKMDEKGKWDEEVAGDRRRIFMSLLRAFLNMDKPPKFYCFIESNIEKAGVDIYTVQFIPDAIKFYMELLSINEINQRTVSFYFQSPDILNDKEGEHIQPYEVPMGEFIALLIGQNMLQEVSSEEVKDNLQVNDLAVDYLPGTLTVTFNIMVKKYKEGLPLPMEAAEETVKKMMDIYASFSDIQTVKLHDTFNDQVRELTFDGRKKIIAPVETSPTLTQLNRANFYFQLANDYYDKKKPDKAEEFYQKVLQTLPNYVYANNYIGFIYLERAEPEKAFSYFQEVLRVDVDNVLAHDGLGHSYTAQSQYQEALTHFKRALEIDPDHAGLLYSIGLVYHDLGEYKKAIDHFQRELERDAKGIRKGEIYRAIGAAYSQLGQHNLALTYHQKAADLDPDNPQLYFDIGLAHYELGNHREAITYFEKELKVNPESFRALYGLGYAYNSLGQHKKAITYYKSALELNPEAEGVYIDLGIAYNGLNQSKEAITYFEKALKRDPKNFQAYYYLGQTYINLTEF